MEDYFKIKLFMEYAIPLIVLGVVGIGIVIAFIYLKVVDIINLIKKKKEKRKEF